MGSRDTHGTHYYRYQGQNARHAHETVSPSWQTRNGGEELCMLNCITLRHAASFQDVRIESYGANAVRVRAVRSGETFKDEPDVIVFISNLQCPH